MNGPEMDLGPEEPARSRRRLVLALVALFLVLAAALGLYFSNRQSATGGSTAIEIAERKQATEDACASATTFEGLKRLVFDQAGRLVPGERTNFDLLAAGAIVRMEEPVVTDVSETLDLTSCEGRFILEVPPGAERGLGGERRLVADVRYEVQAAADGSGPVYRMNGAEAIVARLAAFDMPGRLQSPEATPVDPLAPVEGETLADPGLPVTPGPESPDGEPRASNPSFDCRNARTRGEIMVCASDRLAAQDRAMAARYREAIEDADAATRGLLTQTRDNFLAYRDRCASEDCVAQAYEGRMREIRDIMRDAD